METTNADGGGLITLSWEEFGRGMREIAKFDYANPAAFVEDSAAGENADGDG